MIYEFQLSPNIIQRGNKPYDEDYFKVLCAAASSRDVTELSRLGWKFLVTDVSMFIEIPLSRLAEDENSLRHVATAMNAASWLTAGINKVWPTKAVVLLNVVVHYLSKWNDIQDDIKKRSLAVYQLFVENPDTHEQPSLFGKDFILPYEKTPQYFREGIFV